MEQGNGNNNDKPSRNDAGQSSASPGTPSRTGKSNRGFASMDPERQRQIASQGGKAAHRDGTAHEFTSEEARVAGRKGGEARAAQRSKGVTLRPMGSDTQH